MSDIQYRDYVCFSMMACPKCFRYVEQDSPELEITDEGVIGYNGSWRCDCGEHGTYSFFAELKDFSMCVEGLEPVVTVAKREGGQ